MAGRGAKPRKRPPGARDPGSPSRRNRHSLDDGPRCDISSQGKGFAGGEGEGFVPVGARGGNVMECVGMGGNIGGREEAARASVTRARSIMVCRSAV